MVAFTKIGNTGRADLERNDNFTIRSTEYVPNVTATWKCLSGIQIYGFGLQESQPRIIDLGDNSTCKVIEVVRIDEIIQGQYVWQEKKTWDSV